MLEMRPYRRGGRLAFDPFREMEELERRFFGGPMESFFRTNEMMDFKTDITDQGDSYLLEADLPGFDKDDIHLDLSGNTLTITAERHSDREQKENADKYVRWERSYGKFSRVFEVSEVDAENIKAKYKDGVLRLTMPKKQAALPESRQLPIE